MPLVRLDRSLTLGLFQPLQRIGLRAHGACLPILMYHSISDEPESSLPPYYRVCTSPLRFAEQMEWLAAAGWQGVTLSEGLAALRKQGAGSNEPGDPGHAAPGTHRSIAPAKKLVAITFDDGFQDFYTAAVPNLQRHAFSATMYVPTAFIGDQRKSFKSHACLTWAEVRELASAGIEFGSHTVSHRRLAGLSWTDIETELRDSKAMIEQQLGRAVRSFAYPYAFPQEEKHFARRFREILDTTAYQSCVTTTIGRVSASTDPLHLARLPVNSDDDRALLIAKLAGAYDWLVLPQKIGKSTRRILGVAPRGSQSAPPFEPPRAEQS